MTTTKADGGTGVLAGEDRLLIDGELSARPAAPPRATTTRSR